MFIGKFFFAQVDAFSDSFFYYRCFFGAIFGYPLGYFWGRKWGLFFAGLIFCVGAAMQTAASCVTAFVTPVSVADEFSLLNSSSTGLGLIYAGRVIVGLSIGIASNLAVRTCPFRIEKLPLTLMGN